MLNTKVFLFFLLAYSTVNFSQDISLWQQFNGRYDYIAFGNTLNLEENGGATDCMILEESSAEFLIEADQQIIAAYIYWAGSGKGDFEVSLNGNGVIAERIFGYTLTTATDEYDFFAAFADITNLVSTIGSDTYTLTNLELTEAIQPYCQINVGNATNYGG